MVTTFKSAWNCNLRLAGMPFTQYVDHYANLGSSSHSWGVYRIAWLREQLDQQAGPPVFIRIWDTVNFHPEFRYTSGSQPATWTFQLLQERSSSLQRGVWASTRRILEVMEHACDYVTPVKAGFSTHGVPLLPGMGARCLWCEWGSLSAHGSVSHMKSNFYDDHMSWVLTGG